MSVSRCQYYVMFCLIASTVSLSAMDVCSLLPRLSVDPHACQRVCAWKKKRCKLSAGVIAMKPKLTSDSSVVR